MLEGLLLVFGTCCGLYVALVGERAKLASRSATRIIIQAHAWQKTEAKLLASTEVRQNSSRPAQGEVIGRLSIPELRLSVPILSDYDTKSLREGIGHIPGTAMPGGLGTVGLAGHRDTYFRPLQGIKRGMDIQVADIAGTYHYSVDSTEIVMPEAVRVLDIEARPELTLITCYPFVYIGAAPKRFIVHAHLLSALADEP